MYEYDWYWFKKKCTTNMFCILNVLHNIFIFWELFFHYLRVDSREMTGNVQGEEEMGNDMQQRREH